VAAVVAVGPRRMRAVGTTHQMMNTMKITSGEAGAGETTAAGRGATRVITTRTRTSMPQGRGQTWRARRPLACVMAAAGGELLQQKRRKYGPAVVVHAGEAVRRAPPRVLHQILQQQRRPLRLLQPYLIVVLQLQPQGQVRRAASR
jgi:hypothetical protein